jgi:putative tryptophan/tyrosine transport system substrate-binding protein
MRRREFMTMIGGAVATWPIGVRAQQRAIPVIGFLHVASAEPNANFVVGFRQGLRDAGFIDGQNVAVRLTASGGQSGSSVSARSTLVSGIDIVAMR